MKNRRVFLIIGGGVLLAILIFFIFSFILPQQQKPKETPLPITSKKEVEKKADVDIVKTQIIQQYDSENLRDPFAPLIIKRQITQKGSFPLETYDVEELKLTGIVFDKKAAFALIQTPDGKFYIAKEKDKIGISGGMITKIAKDFVEIKEPPTHGGISPKTKQLKLRTEEEQ